MRNRLNAYVLPMGIAMKKFMKLLISMLMLPVLGLTAASCGGGNGNPKDDKIPS